LNGKFAQGRAGEEKFARLPSGEKAEGSLLGIEIFGTDEEHDRILPRRRDGFQLQP
jgi:hypothetical protein